MPLILSDTTTKAIPMSIELTASPVTALWFAPHLTLANCLTSTCRDQRCQLDMPPGACRRVIQDIMHGKAELMEYDAICAFVSPDYLALAKFM